MLHLPTVLDSSIIATYKSCPHKFFLEYSMDWKPKVPSVHLHAGASFAKGLEVSRNAFYGEGKSTDEAESLGIGAMLAHYGDFECPPDSAKSAERTAGALEFYFDHYPLGADGAEPITLPGGKRGIEISFAEPLPIKHPITEEPFIYAGRLDMAATFAQGLFVEDDKTTSQLGATWSRQWDLRSQFTGYCWGLWKAAGIKPNGVLVRGISILKTKYDTQQAITYRPDFMIDEWYQVLLDTVEDMVHQWKREWFRKDLDHACTEYGGCAFKQPCMSPEPQSWLETHFERRRWDPITRIETKVEA